MSDTSLIFNLLAVDKVSGVLGGISGSFGKLKAGLIVGAVEASAEFIKMAGDFQFGITRLETGAGEAHKNLALVSSGILDMAGQVGESTKDLNAGMYLVESAGYHGAAGLDVLRAAAEGAKVGNADMATVADAVTTALNAYAMGSDHATEATNALIAAEGEGKTNLEALAGSLSTVAPIAAAAHVRLNEVLAAMATMTAEGTPAADAATYLKQTIGQLSNPTAKAALEMKGLGLSAVQVATNLSKNGLASTLNMLTDAIQAKMGPAGLVLIQRLQKAASSTTDFQKVLANLPPTQQTFVGALATMVGGTKSMQAALELTGPHMATFQANIAGIDEHVKAGGKSIEGWSEIQKTFNQQMAEAKGSVEALGVRIGTALMPVALQLIHAVLGIVNAINAHRAAIAGVVGWLDRHKALIRDVAIGLGVLVVITKAHAAAMAIEAGGGTIKFLLAYLNGTKLVAAATKAWAAVQWLLDAAMDANPVGLIILAVAALAAGIFYLWTHSAGFRNFFIGLWADIWGFLKAVGAWFAGPFASFFVGIWDAIAKAALWFWHSVLVPVGNFFVAVWHGIASAALWLWHNVLEPFYAGVTVGIQFVMRILSSFYHLFLDIGSFIFNVIYRGYIQPAIQGMGVLFSWLYNNIFEPLAHGIMIALRGIGDGAMWLWNNAVMPSVHGIAALWMWLGQNIFQPVVNLILSVFHAFETGALWIWHNVAEPVMRGIGIAVSTGKSIIVSGFDAIMDKVHFVGRVFSDVFSAIGGFISRAFSGAVSTVRGAINSIIGAINGAIGLINRNLIDNANKLPGVSFPHIASIPFLSAGGNITHDGFAVVGEDGAEVVSLRAGQTVYPHGSVPAGGADGAVVELRAAPGDRVAETILAILRPHVRGKYGGDVNAALAGRTG